MKTILFLLLFSACALAQAKPDTTKVDSSVVKLQTMIQQWTQQQQQLRDQYLQQEAYLQGMIDRVKQEIEERQSKK